MSYKAQRHLARAQQLLSFGTNDYDDIDRVYIEDAETGPEIYHEVAEWTPMPGIKDVQCHAQLVPKHLAMHTREIYVKYKNKSSKEEENWLNENKGRSRLWRTRFEPTKELEALQKQLTDLGNEIVVHIDLPDGVELESKVDYNNFNPRVFLPFHTHNCATLIVFFDEKGDFDSDTQVCTHETCQEMQPLHRGRKYQYEHIHNGRKYSETVYNDGGDKINYCLAPEQSVDVLKTCAGTSPGRAIYFGKKVHHGCHFWLGDQKEDDLALRLIIKLKYVT